MAEWVALAVFLAASSAVAVLLYLSFRKRDSAPLPRMNHDREAAFAQAAATASADWKRRIEEVKLAHDDTMRIMLQKARKAQTLVNDSGVGDAACELLLIVHRWHRDWERRRRQGGILPARLVLPEGLGDILIGDDGSWISWSVNRVPYRLDYDKRPGCVSFLAGAGQVLCLDVLGDPNMGNLRPGDVAVFRAGDWMTKLCEFVGHLRVADLNSLHADEFRFYGQKADRIAL